VSLDQKGTSAPNKQNKSYDTVEKTAKPEIAFSWLDPAERSDRYIATFDGEEDPQNPLNWPRKRRWAMVSDLSSATLIA
jgi:hypothetical protein